MTASLSRRALCAASVAIGLSIVAAATARAAVAISSKPTQNMACSAGLCVATAKHAVLNATDLTAMLAASDITVVPGKKALDIDVRSAFSWASANRLTLDSYRSIAIEDSVTVAGPGGLTLRTNDGGTGGDYWFAGKGNVNFWDLSSSLVINGNGYSLIDSIATLAASVAANSSGFYALAKTYDASVDGTYVSAPVTTALNGGFEGLGNTISGLSVNDQNWSESVGLFAQLAATGTIRDINLSRPSFTASQYSNLGAIVGHSSGTVRRSSASGTISGTYNSCIGGLVGASDTGARVSESSSTAAVALLYSGNGDVGGLVGCNDGTVLSSHAKGAAFGGEGTAIGGLVGYNFTDGLIQGSYATGKESASDQGSGAGGLVGRNDGTVETSSASGDAVGCSQCGGLVGFNMGLITQTHASGAVKVNRNLPSGGGGLVGSNVGSIEKSYSTGAVTGGGSHGYGGLVGENYATIENAYATGSVTAKGQAAAGGLVGVNFGTIGKTYSTGAVTADKGLLGGLIGIDQASAGHIDSSYWDIETSGVSDLSHGAGNVANDPGIAGLSTAQFQSGLPPGFDPSIWSEDPGINGGFPYLIANPPPK